MTQQRWPFQATIEDKALIDAINAARPLDRTSIADGIRYALGYTVGNDPDVMAMVETDFRADGTLYNTSDDREIEYMVISERAGGMFQSLLCRKPRKSGPGYYYADVGWNGNNGQMRSGKWFCGGRTASAVEYVANWRKRQ